MEIRFYGVKERPYGAFSNFAPYAFRLDGVVWPTSEHYFQAQKFAPHTEHVEAIRQMNSPMTAARAGRSRSRPLRPDWEAVKDDVMRRALRAKFDAHPVLHDLLLATEDAELIEQTSGDYYWGCGTEGTGKNRLGELLMELRDTLRTEATSRKKL